MSADRVGRIPIQPGVFIGLREHARLGYPGLSAPWNLHVISNCKPCVRPAVVPGVEFRRGARPSGRRMRRAACAPSEGREVVAVADRANLTWCHAATQALYRAQMQEREACGEEGGSGCTEGKGGAG